MKRFLIIIVCFVCYSSLLWAQSDQESFDNNGEGIELEEQPESYDMWSDPLYYQFEKMLNKLSKSVGRLNNRISTLAVTDMEFSLGLDKSFQKVASAKLYGQMLMENPKLRLIKCNECNMVRSHIKAGILTITRGLANQEARQVLADKLGVQGFMVLAVTLEKRQLTIVVNVYDAKEGRIILSDVITGIPVPETVYYNIYFGKMSLPVTLASGSALEHSILLLGVEKSIRFAESWLLSANAAFYMDNNALLEADHVTFTSGLIVDGTIGWEVASLMNNNTSIVLKGGIGQFISAQMNFTGYIKLGIKMAIGQAITFNVYAHSLLSDQLNLEKPESSGTSDQSNSEESESGGTTVNQLKGMPISISLGYQF